MVSRPGDPAALYDEALPLLKTHAVVHVYPRFTEHIPSPAEHTEFQRVAALTGRTVASLQIWDIMRAVRWAAETTAPERISIYGRGAAGIVALYAALFVPIVSQVILNDPPVSHHDGPALLTILRTTDIPEVAASLAPRQLSMLSYCPGAFDFTRQVYRLCHAEENFQIRCSLPAALMPEVTSSN